ncbi:chromate efflux transporter [Rhizobium sp. SSA_523]|uniref:chromate efflux transporter n=1 Tax=Rhizobium sp. SSA_523 TaxID=2952477 RepID=UPI0020910827|nr:chromate efflux transporter [Rhizobium sp. SSA_523]MCO5733181.1 chromate efflux transporter [Rhizobium sp. SSA_523]WKC24051.1 chromate efflux transporter [Rhizobium sp. SSA_523]
MKPDQAEALQPPLGKRQNQPSLRELVLVFARIGCLSFGGPAAQIGLMHRICVEEKRWILEDRYLHALNYCMLLPGPEAQQLATYIGWLTHGVRGGMLAGLLFVLPGLFVIIALSTAYALYQQADWLAGLFFGLKAAVLTIVLQAVVRLARRTLTDRVLVVIAVLAFLSLFVLALPFPLVVLVAGLAGYLRARHGAVSAAAKPAAVLVPEDVSPQKPPLLRSLLQLGFWVAVWQLPFVILLAISGAASLATMYAFFSQMALVTFGGAYAVLSYVAQVAVEDYGWLQPGEMLDGLALAETTPGPLVLVLSYVGYLTGFRTVPGLDPVIGGIIGALLTAWATFVPSFIWIFAGAPYIERLRGKPQIAAALSAITAAVVGVIANLALWFALHVLFGRVERVTLVPGWTGEGAPGLWLPDPATLDPAALVLFLISALALLRLNIGMVKVLVSAALGGLLWRLAGF